MNNSNAIFPALPLPLPPPPPPRLAPQSQQQPLAQGQQQPQLHQSQKQQQSQQQSSQHPRVIHQRQYSTTSPHQPQSSQSQFNPSLQPTHTLVQQPSPYAAPPQGLLHHHQSTDPGFFNAHPSPYSTNSAAGSYTSSDANDAMAQATMSRQQYPPITSLQTPQSNSPASMHSPHHDASGRGIYAYPPMAQPMYYPPSYPMHQPVTYAQQPPTPSHAYPPVTSSPSMMMQQQQHQQQQQQQQQQQHHHHHHQQQQQTHHSAYAPQPQHTPSQSQSSIMKSDTPQPSMQRPSIIAPPPPPPIQQSQQSVQQQHQAQHQIQHQAQQNTPQPPSGPTMHNLTLSSSNGPNPAAAPGPIPATTPLVVHQDQNGVQWILFEYSRDRVKMEYTIRCDVESVEVEKLGQEFKSANCVYPRACGGKDAYKGNRLQYESECNAVGWALAELNPNLREKRGLIQRAVDSWRNSNRDVRLRSRRVRRQHKMNNRKQQASAAGVGQVGGPSPNTSLQGPSPQMHHGRSGSIAHPIPQMHHHGDSHDSRGTEVSDSQYHSSSSSHQHMPPTGLPSPASIRYTQQFYPQYPQQPGIGAATMPSVHDDMNSMGHHPSTTLATSITASVKDVDEDNRTLFGDVPETKRRKFILVDDHQRGTRVRVRVMLDQVKMDDMPDAHLRINAVYPRSYYPRQMHSPTISPRSRGVWDDDDDTFEDGQRGKTFVPVKNVDGSEEKLAVPRMTRSRRKNEVALNELGYRMSWGQARTFNGRTLFLQRSLDAYRGKMRHTMTTAGRAPDSIAPHFELRPGKRKLLQRGKHERRDSHAS